jgi:hypothetical protein
MACAYESDGPRVEFLKFPQHKKKCRRIINFLEQIGVLFVPHGHNPAAKFIQPLQLVVNKLLAIGKVKDVRSEFLIDSRNSNQLACRRLKNIFGGLEIRDKCANFLRADAWHGRKLKKRANIHHKKIYC